MGSSKVEVFVKISEVVFAMWGSNFTLFNSLYKLWCRNCDNNRQTVRCGSKSLLLFSDADLAKQAVTTSDSIPQHG